MSDEVVIKLIELTKEDKLEWSSVRKVMHNGTPLVIGVESLNWNLVSDNIVLSKNDKLLSVLVNEIDEYKLRFAEHKKTLITSAILGW